MQDYLVETSKTILLNVETTELTILTSKILASHLLSSVPPKNSERELIHLGRAGANASTEISTRTLKRALALEKRS